MLTGWRAVLAVLLLAVGLWAGMLALDLRDLLSLEALRTQLAAHRLSGLLVFTLLFALGNLAQIPGGVFLAAAVLTFGRLWGGVATYAAASVASTAVFLTVRTIGGGALRTLDQAWAQRILARLDARPVLGVFLLRLVFQTQPTLNYALAMSGIRLRHLVVGTVLGLPVPIALYCIFFDALARGLHIAAG
jgi:uncharacterized membrane protein YdjX (TVP38/TMEM64 family)